MLISINCIDIQACLGSSSPATLPASRKSSDSKNSISPPSPYFQHKDLMETPSPQKSLTGDADSCPCCGHKRRRSDSPPVASSIVAAAETPGHPISELDKRGSGAARQRQPSPASSPLPFKPAPSTSSVAQLVEPDPEGKHNKVRRAARQQQPSPASSPLPLEPAPSTSSVAQLVEPDPEGKHKKEEKNKVEIKVAQGTQVTESEGQFGGGL